MARVCKGCRRVAAQGTPPARRRGSSPTQRSERARRGWWTSRRQCTVWAWGFLRPMGLRPPCHGVSERPCAAAAPTYASGCKTALSRMLSWPRIASSLPRAVDGVCDETVADPADIRIMMIGDPRPRGGDQGRPVAGSAGDTREARGLQRFGQTHGRHDGGQPARQHRLPHPRWSQEQDVGGRTPASASPQTLWMPTEGPVHRRFSLRQRHRRIS
jgi:hypothetical protein